MSTDLYDVENMPRLVLCKECGIKPKLKSIAYSDKDDEVYRQCPKYKKRTSDHTAYLPSEQRRMAQIEWCSMNEGAPISPRWNEKIGKIGG